MCVMSSPAITFSISPDMCTDEPVPEEPKLIRPGRALMKPISSFTLVTGIGSAYGPAYGYRKEKRILPVNPEGIGLGRARRRLGSRSLPYRSVSYMIEFAALFLVIT